LSDIFQKLKTDGKVKERTVVQAMKYISNRKDGTKRNPKKPSCRWWCHVEGAVCAGCKLTRLLEKINYHSIKLHALFSFGPESDIFYFQWLNQIASNPLFRNDLIFWFVNKNYIKTITSLRFNLYFRLHNYIFPHVTIFLLLRFSQQYHGIYFGFVRNLNFAS